jgi:hypothetical protein
MRQDGIGRQRHCIAPALQQQLHQLEVVVDHCAARRVGCTRLRALQSKCFILGNHSKVLTCITFKSCFWVKLSKAYHIVQQQACWGIDLSRQAGLRRFAGHPHEHGIAPVGSSADDVYQHVVHLSTPSEVSQGPQRCSEMIRAFHATTLGRNDLQRAQLTPSLEASASPMMASIIGPKNLVPKRPKMEVVRSAAGSYTHRISSSVNSAAGKCHVSLKSKTQWQVLYQD